MIKRHILLVDKETRFANCFKIFLEDKGYVVTLATNGGEAFEKAKKIYRDGIKIDLLIVDIQMSLTPNLEFLDSLAAENIKPAIIAIGSVDEDEIQDKLSQYGCINYISKPFTPCDMIEKIENILA
jgi:DNA-binding response OmpR family regulator